MSGIEQNKLLFVQFLVPGRNDFLYKIDFLYTISSQAYFYEGLLKEVISNTLLPSCTNTW